MLINNILTNSQIENNKLEKKEKSFQFQIFLSFQVYSKIPG